jgi:hypothetical protein
MPSAQRLRNSLWTLIEKSDLREYYNSLTGEATARKRSRDRDFWSICVSSTRNYLPRSTCSCISTKKEHVALSWGVHSRGVGRRLWEITPQRLWLGNHATAIVVCDPPDRNQWTD